MMIPTLPCRASTTELARIISNMNQILRLTCAGVLELPRDLVLELAAVHGFPPASSARRIAALYHEVADDPMKLKSRGEKCQSGYRWVHYMANHVPMQSCMNRHGSDACC